ncbi:MAG: molybdopterin molybdotransferase MoeA [Planctomycetales bacterium]|nr:molybdopterin molybdotransferase MoeA [Planctomycetales bacterium]
MISVDEARALVLDQSRPLAQVETPLAAALDGILAVDARSDVDSPPHDKSVVDGYALRAADLSDGRGELAILEEVTAGQMPTHSVTVNACTRIMTGAPIPAGADAVVMIERTELLADDRVRIDDPRCVAGQNIMPQASSLRQGEVVVHRGTRLRPIDIGLLAETGHAHVRVFDRPRVAMLATGNELVAIDQQPGPGKIRNSNSHLLASLLAQAQARPAPLGIARDDRSALREAIERGLDCDALLLSGGVSAGVLDLVPAVLAELGVQAVFHKVRVKPGKPLWFGVHERAAHRCLVFGLPGNPLSGLVNFELFVRPALRTMQGETDVTPAYERARLGQEFRQRGTRQTYYPATLRRQAMSSTITPVEWRGSADLRGFAAANALAMFPAGERRFDEGEEIDVLPLQDVRG